MKVRIKVTAEDIANGRQRQPTECPLARAIRRRLGGLYVSVGHQSVTRRQEMSFKYAYLSRRAQQFICAFDRGRTVKPSIFMLEFD